ncbi:peptidoglycan-binding protein [Ramlibacter sp. AN1015]|uniref:ZIP family metal transporter n=1 Tax=Ramlibacter sp. AN1015 TaxID=3133428 RepID=UPI0030C5AF75
MDPWLVLGLALLPAIGNFGGGMLAEFFPTNNRIVSIALHGAAGIVIAVVSTELMPEALEQLSPWLVAAAFGAGGVSYVAISGAVDRLQASAKPKGGASSSGMWMIYIAVSMDLASDGLMIGSGSAVSASMALVLAMGQVLADIPEGYATIANMKENEVPRSRRILLSASFVIPVVGMAMVSYFLLRDVADAWKMGALAFVAGLLSLAAVEDMISEAHESGEDTKWSMLAFTSGFVLFVLVSAGLERFSRHYLSDASKPPERSMATRT